VPAMELIEEAVRMGAGLGKACVAVGLTLRTYERWKGASGEGDRRRGPVTAPANKLSEQEHARVKEIATSKEFCDLPPSQIVPRLADRSEYVASESTFYRVLREEELLSHRGKAQPRTHSRPDPFVATGPNQVWSWDITYLLAAVQGMFFYAYLFVDIFSRKIVAGEVFEEEEGAHSALMLRRACLQYGICEDELVLHSDNGGPMKGATMLATLQRLGVMASFSRPSVSDDNPYSEALFRTMKYRPEYPSKPFETLAQAQAWLREFIAWYNHCHLHSGVNFVTPADRHAGRDLKILEARKQVYQEARSKNPSRWSRGIRNWDRIEEVALNPNKTMEVVMKEAA
jgi:putative transposase